MTVEVCPICDIAGCHHIRERNERKAAPIQTSEAKERERCAALEMLLARLLVLSPGSSEDALNAIGGWGRLHALMGEYRAANPEAP